MEYANLFVKCMTCHSWDSATVDTDKLRLYLTGKFVQDVWPDEDTWVREVIIGWRTGVFMCKDCCEDAERDLKEASDASWV